MSIHQPAGSAQGMLGHLRAQELIDTVHMGTGKDDPMPLFIGSMEVRRRVGIGGFGIVYAAFDEGLGKEVAVKVPRLQFIPNQILMDRFVREMRSGSLDHPNILTVIRAGHDNNLPYLVMPLCEGIDLANWLSRKDETDKALPLDLVLCWGIQITKAVDYAHKRGVLHRDLKPSNIMLDQSGGSKEPRDWVPRLTDFGLAKALAENESQSSLTKQGDILGTPEYMAPEQLAGDTHNIGVATDVHGLGTILHEMVYGVSPYGGHDRTNTLFKVINLAPEYPSTMKRRVPPDLRAVIEKCLAKNPEDRFQSASELLEELEKVRDGKPTRTRPLTLMGYGLRWGWRHPVGAMAAVIIATLLTVLVVGVVKFQIASNKMLQEQKEINTELQRKERERVMALASSQMREAYVYINQDRSDLAFDRLQQPEVQGTMPLVEGLLRHQLMNRQVVFYPGHYTWVDQMTLSANEHCVLTRGSDENVLLLDLISGASRSLLLPEESIQRGGTTHRLPMFHNDKHQACWWSAKEAEPRLERYPLPNWPESDYLSVAASVDGRRWFASHPREGLVIHEVATGSQTRIPWPTGFASEPNRNTNLWSSPSGNWLLIHQKGRGYLSWDVNLPDQLTPVAIAPSNTLREQPVLALAFSTDEQTLYAWVYAQEVTTVRRQPLSATSTRYDKILEKFCFNPQSQLDHRHVCQDVAEPNVLYLGSNQGQLVRYDLATGRADPLMQLAHRVRMICPGAANELLVQDDQQLFAYDLKQRAISASWPVPESLQSEDVDDSQNVVSYLPSQRALLMAGRDGRIAKWNLLYEKHDPLWHRDRSEVHGIQFSHDSRLLATGADNGDIHVWEAASGRLLRSINKAHDIVVMSLCFSPDGQSLFSGSYDGDIKQWNVATGELVRTYVGTPAKIRSIVYSPKHGRLFAGCREGFLVSWHLEQPNQCQWTRMHGKNIKSLHLSADETRLYTGGEDYRILCLDPATGRELDKYKDQQESWCVVERGSNLYTAGAAAHLSVYDRQTHRKLADLRDSFSNHNALVVSQDGKIMISAGEAAPIRIWNVQTKSVVGMLHTSHEQIYKLALSPNDRYLAASCKSGKVLLYPIDTLPTANK